MSSHSSTHDFRRIWDELVEAAHFLVPDEVPAVVSDYAHVVGARSAVVYLADLNQRWLVPLPRLEPDAAEPVAIDRTLAGRSFRAVSLIEAVADAGERSVWVPLLDGTERLGVLQLLFAETESGEADDMRAFAGLVADLIVTKKAYGDFFHVVERQEPITVASEQLWQLLPPLTFASHDLVIAAVFVPTADLGGDAFDYGVDLEWARVAIFDAMGHGLDAGLMATAAVAAYRNSRRSGLELADTAARIGDIIERHFGKAKFVTGIVAALNVRSGRFTWCVAGHPPPLVIRQGQVVKHLDPGRGLPFGVGPASAVFEEQLEPGDRVLLYTDGVTEARDAVGRLFGVDELVNLITRTSGNEPPPEAMRRLMRAIEAHNRGAMRDDATVVEWRGTGPDELRM